MKYSFLYYSVVIVLVCMIGCSSAGKKEAVFYVSPSGNDAWSGKFPESNRKGTDGPFTTLEKARDAARALRKTGAFPDSGVIVDIRGGVYSIEKTLELTAEDSGTETAPVVWRAHTGEKVHFIGGKIVTGFKPVTDSLVLSRLDESVRDSVLVANLKGQGINEYGAITLDKGVGMELFYNDKVMTIARYPNEGWLTIADVPQTGTLVNKGDYKIIEDGHWVGRHFGRFSYSGDRPKRWAMRDDIWMFGFWAWDWMDTFLRVEKIDTTRREVYPGLPHHHYGYRKGQRYFFLNILEELDSPGEYYIDRENGLLYFLPPDDITDSNVFCTMFDTLMVSLKETSYVTFAGIEFNGSRAPAIQIEGGTGNCIAGCVIHNIRADYGVMITGGTRNGILSCDIYDMGATGVRLNGGDRMKLIPAGNYATNNHVYHYGTLVKSWKPAFYMEGVGNIVSHNYIHDAPFSAVQHYGNDLVIEYNEVHDIAQETDDVGGFNTGHNWTFRGNIIRYNFLHHIHSATSHVGCIALYNDLPGSGAHFYGNVVWDVDRGFLTNSGRDNIIENNIFVHCPRGSFYFNLWPEPPMFQKGSRYRLYEELQEVNYKEPPYSVRYPELQNIYRDGDPAVPTGNRVICNISYGAAFLILSTELDLPVFTLENNLIADTVLLRKRIVLPAMTSPKAVEVEYKYGDAPIMQELEKRGNVVIQGNPGFVDAEHGNFTLKEDSPAIKLGFKPIPFDKIGLYIDQYRTTLPDKRR